MGKNKGYVFIVGLPRSGTSIVYRTIQKLPGFLSSRINLWETSIFRKHISFQTTELYYPELLGYIDNNKAVYESFLEAVKGYTRRLGKRQKVETYHLDIPRDNTPDSRFKRLFRQAQLKYRWKRGCKIRVIKEFFKHALAHRQSRRLVEKTPHHYLNVHQILWTFPKACIIWMVRHPIDVFTSSIKRAKKDKDYTHYWQVDSFIKEYAESVKRCDYYKRMFKNNILVVVYEDFVSNPESELEKICAFLDEPYSSDSLELSENEAFQWRPDPHLSSKIVKKTEKKWQDHLSREDAQKIETQLQDLMELYGFNFYST